MLTLNLRFLAGRYHATPWGRHVNEADLAWPPEPWRILRALIAVWHRKLDEDQYPERVLEGLIAKLASRRPVFQAPAAIHSHTRHYMPTREGKKKKTALVYDSFLRLRRDEALRVSWVAVELEAEELELARLLAEALAYLGRAESWVEASVTTDGIEPNCYPVDETLHRGDDSPMEPIALLCAKRAEEYTAWREAFLKQRDASERRKSRRAIAKRLLDATLPARLIDALRLETAELQAAGWSRAPASTTVRYLRPAGLVRPFAEGRRTHRPAPKVTTARFSLVGRPLPRAEDAVRVAESLRRALLGCAKRVLGQDQLPPCLTGHDLPEGMTHGHAFYLPEPDPRSGRISHVLVHADMGLSPDAQRVLDSLRRVRGFDGQEWRLGLEAMGNLEQLSSVTRLLGPSETWISLTPYLHPWHAKPGFGYEAQLRKECRERRLPEVVHLQPSRFVEVGRGRRRPVHFHRFRSRRGLTQPDTRGSFWRLRFAAAIHGPLALGFGCHFGLGMFWPSRDNSPSLSFETNTLTE